MIGAPQKCPACGLYAPPGTRACDCGFQFTGSPPRPARAVGFASDATLVSAIGSAFLWASVLLVALSRSLVLLGSEAGTVWLVVAPVTFGVLAAVLSRQSEVANVAGAFGIFAGIAVGVGVDIALAMALGEPERNLWPLEIVFYWVVAAVPVLLGINAGRYADRRSSPRSR
jgi:hypothetical protein